MVGKPSALNAGDEGLLPAVHFQIFFFCIPSYISGVHHYGWDSSSFSSSSPSAFQSMSLVFTILGEILLFLLHSQQYLWGSPFFFFFVFCIPSYISGVHHNGWDSSSSSSAFPAISLGFTILGEILLLLHSHLYLWGSPFWVRFFCIPSYISGVHHNGWHSSSSVFPAIHLGFTILGAILLLLLLLQS